MNDQTAREVTVGANSYRRTIARIAVGLVATLILAGCTPGKPAPDSSPVSLPGTSVGQQAAWVIDTLNADEEPRQHEIESHLAPVMFDEVTPQEYLAVFEQFWAQNPWTPTAVDAVDEHAMVTIESPSAGSVELEVSVDADELISGLFFRPVEEDRTPAADWDELEQNATSLGLTMLVTPVDGDGQVDPNAMIDIDSDEVRPVGSIFKLYVLGAVSDAVAAGRLSWDDELTVTDAVRSLPSGELQDAPSGTPVTVREAAEKMIAISDNTATDMLMAAVGRAAVEQAMGDMGHHDPSLNTPFLTTRELFYLGWSDDTSAEQWGEADTAERVEMIAHVPAGELDVAAEDLIDPVWTHDLGWFSTAHDIAAAHLALQLRAETDAGEPIRGILSANNGLALETGDDAEWAFIAFKGGSSIGVLAGSWYAERADGERFVITVQAAQTDPQAISTREVLAQAEDAFSLLAR